MSTTSRVFQLIKYGKGGIEVILSDTSQQVMYCPSYMNDADTTSFKLYDPNDKAVFAMRAHPLREGHFHPHTFYCSWWNPGQQMFEESMEATISFTTASNGGHGFEYNLKGKHKHYHIRSPWPVNAYEWHLKDTKHAGKHFNVAECSPNAFAFTVGYGLRVHENMDSFLCIGIATLLHRCHDWKAENPKKLISGDEAIHLQRIGNCPAGYHWHREAGGYRCDGGHHFVSDEELARQGIFY